MIPFYIYYSMFGFQRVGDLAWAAGDMRARGFLMGGTAGRTTLNGEGLQHEDGHSHVLAATIPNCVSYDPTFSYEVAVIIQDGLRRMYAEQEDVFYYITVMNENYQHPALPEGARGRGASESSRGCTCSGRERPPRKRPAGAAVRLRHDPARGRSRPPTCCEQDWDVAADVWSVPSFTELATRRHGRRAVEHAASQRGAPAVLRRDPARRAAGRTGCRRDRLHRAFAEQIRPYVKRRYHVLGTDGFGRSDYRRKLREHFEVDRHFVTVAALTELAAEGTVPIGTASEAIAKYGLNPDKSDPARA